MTDLFDELNRLVAEKLVKRKDYDNGLCIFKYQPKVHWDNLWSYSPALIRARGIVFTNDGEQVNDPLPKLFYLGENGTKVNRDTIVHAQRKVNGFYASVAWRGQDRIVATTGTLDSEYVAMANEVLDRGKLEQHRQSGTNHYEIVHEKDQHIIPELPGAYNLGSPVYGDGHTTETLWEVRFSDVVQYAKKVKHEGFVVYDPDTREPLWKIKSPYYLGLKLMARFTGWKFDADTDRITLKRRADEEYGPLIDHIFDVYGVDKFVKLHEQEKLEMMRDFIDREALNDAVVYV